MKRPEFKNTGVQARALVDLVQNAAPYLFAANESDPRFLQHPFRYTQILKAVPENADRDLWAYFDLCLAAHFASVGTFVPTDVDIAIREKLWRCVHREETFEPMWSTVKEFGRWDESWVSRRYVKWSDYKLSGHQGEWLSIALGAYGTALKIAPSFVPEIREAIAENIELQEKTLLALKEIFEEKCDADSLKALLSGVAAVAHNLGDLDRMIDTWELGDLDAVKRRFYRLGHEDARSPRPIFYRSGVFYQKMLASENHRHFALRDPKALRKTSAFLLPYAPLLDEWGKSLVSEGVKLGLLNERELREICEALILGWKRLNQKTIYHSQGYARALAGIQNALPNRRADLEALLPPALRKEILEGGLRTHLSVPQKTVEDRWIKTVGREIGEWINGLES